MRIRSSPNFRVVVIMAAVVGAAVAFAIFPVQKPLLILLDVLRAWGLWGLAALAILYIVACVLVVPASILTVGAGFLAASIWPTRPVLAIVVGTVVVSASSVVGASLAFILGRSVTRDWVAGRIENHGRFQRLDEAIKKEGFKIVLLLRLSPIMPFNVLNYVLGLTSVRLRDYIIASAIGMLPATALFVYAGSVTHTFAAAAAGQAELSTSHYVLPALGLCASLVLVMLLARIAGKALGTAQ